jgi:alkanesulfonate monooxygenase SsuD/methylene tetrahydromethanopterin reductase-like flavin-dependent oxidoreductase (luciferase family)
MSGVRFGFSVAPACELADPGLLVDLARWAEARQWDGWFLWDHLARPEPGVEILDPWTVLGALAVRTERLRIGTMVTPLPRRRPQVVAKQAATLDRLSDGRMVLGLGLGVDSARELSGFGEPGDPAERGRMLSEGADVVDRLLRGDVVTHHGAAYDVEDMALAPGCVQEPRLPMWFATRTTAPAPLRRAAAYDGIAPVELSPEQLADVVGQVAALRGGRDGLVGFDVVPCLDAGTDADAHVRAGATWVLWQVPPGTGPAELAAWIDAGPPS